MAEIKLKCTTGCMQRHGIVESSEGNQLLIEEYALDINLIIRTKKI
jgi:hypothetical protein